jgi:hypothetical protein
MDDRQWQRFQHVPPDSPDHRAYIPIEGIEEAVRPHFSPIGILDRVPRNAPRFAGLAAVPRSRDRYRPDRKRRLNRKGHLTDAPVIDGEITQPASGDGDHGRLGRLGRFENSCLDIPLKLRASL